jgi:ribosomal protein S18 acetylase RimI-like enzyme
MRKTTAGLILRARRPSDDRFIYRLSERAFAPYSVSPTRAMASMVEEPGAVTMIARRGSAPVGFFVLAFARIGRPYGPWQRPVLARLNAICVTPDAQGRGVGRVLLECAEDIARGEGAISLTLMTAETNTPARGLFESAGFLRLYEQEGAYAGGQRGFVMTKLL